MEFIFLCFAILYFFAYYKLSGEIKDNLDDVLFFKIRRMREDEDYKYIKLFYYSIFLSSLYLVFLYYIFAPILILLFKDTKSHYIKLFIPRLVFAISVLVVILPFFVIMVFFSVYAKYKVYKTEKITQGNKILVKKYFINGSTKTFYKNKLHNEEIYAVSYYEELFNMDLFFHSKSAFYIRGEEIKIENEKHRKHSTIQGLLKAKEKQKNIIDF